MRDHPRIRGEHGERKVGEVSSDGSSPHTRGAPTNSSHRRRKVGIIPAYAGSTSPAPAGQGPTPDHPRIRGEHGSWGRVSLAGLGSSPHTRGAPSGPVAASAPGRIIPAYAGSTRRKPRTPAPKPDHPRIRGEHVSNSLDGTMPYGSSPHTRGAPQPHQTGNAVRGIIPAYAGSTF